MSTVKTTVLDLLLIRADSKIQGSFHIAGHTKEGRVNPAPLLLTLIFTTLPQCIA